MSEQPFRFEQKLHKPNCKRLTNCVAMDGRKASVDGNVFVKDNMRELVTLPPPCETVHYHSLVAELGDDRAREFVVSSNNWPATLLPPPPFCLRYALEAV
jgi:hypothetical protein